jgi:CRISPR-associated protein Csd2
MSPITHRYDFVFLFDVTNGNPNGDPDAGNAPRMDPETGRGLVTDVALKRRLRNYVSATRAQDPGYEIYVAERAVLNRAHERAYAALNLEIEPKKVPSDEDQARNLIRWMCDNFYDIRAFGAVMTTQINAGQVRGPIQMTFAQSIDPIMPLDVTLTRNAVTNEEDAQRTDRTMGRKYIVPYGLYRAHGFVSARLANDPVKGTGLSQEDLELFWRGLCEMFEHDRASSRGEMSARGLFVFRHESDLGNALAHTLFDRVTIEPAGAEGRIARAFSDYVVKVNEDNMPAGVTLERRL